MTFKPTLGPCSSTYTINFDTGKKLECEFHSFDPELGIWRHAVNYLGRGYGWTDAEADENA